MNNAPTLSLGSLRDAPSLIEAVFPAQKVSFEAQRERKAGPAQTLTSLGSYWKGRKPLILVRSILMDWRGALMLLMHSLPRNYRKYFQLPIPNDSLVGEAGDGKFLKMTNSNSTRELYLL